MRSIILSIMIIFLPGFAWSLGDMGTTQGKNIPFASTATPGKVMVDGSSITISNGTISSHAGSGGGITAVTGVSPIAVSSGGTPAVSLGSVPFKNISAALRAHGFTF